jgi:hypothetical protein
MLPGFHEEEMIYVDIRTLVCLPTVSVLISTGRKRLKISILVEACGDSPAALKEPTLDHAKGCKGYSARYSSTGPLWATY